MDTPDDSPATEPEPRPADEVDHDPSAAEPAPMPNWAIGLIVLGVLVLGVQAALGWVLIDRTDAISDELAAVAVDADTVSQRLDVLEAGIAAVGAEVAAIGGDGGVSVVEPGDSGTEGALPTYPSSGPDPAVGLTIPELTGDDYYTGEATRIGVADGKATVTMVWAHWCPYCQNEVPMLQEVVGEGALDPYDAVQLQTVTTFIDPSRPNPLIPYLDDLGLDYPVVVDTDGSMAAALGMSAVPAWVVTDPDGVVLGRFTGAIGRDAFLSVVEEAQRIATEGA